MREMKAQKKVVERVEYIRAALDDMINGLNGKPFTWGAAEREAKEYILARLGYIIVSKSRLEKGGHELKQGVQPIGKAYFKAPLKLYADMYLLDVQTRRAVPGWHNAYEKGKALLEGDHQFTREEYAKRPIKYTMDEAKKLIEGSM